jgi:hypothetical protein
VLLVGGLAGATVGIQIFSMLRRLGQLDLIISLLYVVFLGSVGGLMLWESVNSLRRAANNKPVSLRKPGQHNWVHRLPFKMRFKRSKLYLSVIPVIAARLRHRHPDLRDGRWRRFHHGSGHDLSFAHPHQRGDRDIAVSDHFRDRLHHSRPGDDQLYCRHRVSPGC